VCLQGSGTRWKELVVEKTNPPSVVIVGGGLKTVAEKKKPLCDRFYAIVRGPLEMVVEKTT